MDCSTPGFPVHQQLPELHNFPVFHQLPNLSESLERFPFASPVLSTPSACTHTHTHIHIHASHPQLHTYTVALKHIYTHTHTHTHMHATHSQTHAETHIHTLIHSHALQTHTCSPPGMLQRLVGRSEKCFTCSRSQSTPGAGLGLYPKVTTPIQATRLPLTGRAGPQAARVCLGASITVPVCCHQQLMPEPTIS